MPSHRGRPPSGRSGGAHDAHESTEPDPFAGAAELGCKTLRAAIDQAVDSIVVADARGRILYLNAAAGREVGRSPGELIGKHFLVALAAGQDPAQNESISRTVGEGGTWSGTYAATSAGGSRVATDLVVTPVHDDAGRITSVVAVGRNLSRDRSDDSEALGVALADRVQVGELRAIHQELVRDGAFQPLFQPIVRLRDGEVIGYEALTRFDDGTPPDVRFAEAAAIGLGVDLEIATLEAALAAARQLPDAVFLTVNVSPALIAERTHLQDLLRSAGRDRIVLEITERQRIDDYQALREAISQVAADAEWAIDDAGAGYASLRHILELRPHFVKLDRALIADVALDPARQALVSGLLQFSDALGTTLVAEGIETNAERLALEQLGLTIGQGYLFGRPQDPRSAAARRRSHPHARKPGRLPGSGSR